MKIKYGNFPNRKSENLGKRLETNQYMRSGRKGISERVLGIK